MENGIKERKDGRNLEQIYIYQARKIRQNAENRLNTRIKYGDQAHRRSTLADKDDKNIILGERIDFDPFIG